MAKQSAKTQAMRILDAAGVAYQAAAYPAEVRDAADVAQHLGEPPERVYKTLVAVPEEPPGRAVLIMLAAQDMLDLKQAAAQIGIKRLRMAAHEEAERLTGLKVGGISAVALAGKRFDIFLDAKAAELPYILVSAGQRGVDLRLQTTDLMRVTGAKLIHAARAEPAQGEAAPQGG